jgi:exodeoxyribonuclease V beta subunit
MTATPFQAQAFDPYGTLPEGTTVLEASAGTGKTHTIAALVTRLVAEGAAQLDQMLIVTFSRAATGELRERVRARLTTAERGLADPASADDPLVALLAAGSDKTVAARRHRLAAALAAFDAATIATTHQFCAQVLAGLGVTADLSDVAGGERFVESLDDLVVEVAEDLYLRKFAGPQEGDGAPTLTIEEALAVSRAAVIREPGARLEPAAAPADSPAGMRHRLAEAVRAEVVRRKRIRGIRSYDDLQADLAAVLTDPALGQAACSRLRSRFPVVLIDEFQDTDPVQWEIVSRAFVGHCRVVLIGDPKQAIYGFRGADVTAYLDAARAADTVATLEYNWRSEPGLLEALDALFGDATFGDPRIGYRRVQAAKPQEMLRGAPSSAALRLRLLPRGPGDSLSGKGLLRVEPVRSRVAADVAADIAELLGSGAQVASASGQFHAIAPGDIATLVRTNNQATQVHDALRERGVPAVIGGASSVFTAPVARQWLILLEALEQPHRAVRVKAAALTCFLGWSAEQLATADAAQTDALSALVRGWATLVASQGVAALQETITASQQLPARLLSEPDGERRLTDLRHIAETLHAAVSAEGLGITALIAWLRRRIEDADKATDGVEERSRRLDSDADAVQVVTIHRSKGLEFPVVYVPFAWDEHQARIDLPRYHDAKGARVLDVGCGLGGSDPAQFSEGIVRHQREEAGEQLRLLYVAVTRARSQAVLWWAPATTTECASLSRLLFGYDRSQPGEPAPSIAVPNDPDAEQRTRALAAACPTRFAVEVVTDRLAVRWKHSQAPVRDLKTASFDRQLDRSWRRTSYSALTAAAHDAAILAAAPAVSSEPEDGALDDEPADEQLALPGRSVDRPSAAAAVVSPMAHLPGGTAFGSLVHGVLETVDTAATDLAAEVRDRIAEQLARWSTGRVTIDADVLSSALLAVYDTPLGPAADDLRLRDFAPGDRLTEMAFELPLTGGDQPGGELMLGELAPLLRQHLGRPGAPDELAGYADRLTDPWLRDQPLRGFLNGSLDAVLRVRDARFPAAARHVVVDYKTNWLSDAPAGGGQLTTADYTPERLAAAMLASDYPLQALLYSVALHRYLRWRQPDYAPEKHLGGVLYLYVRGMCGAGTPVIAGQPCGVFAWAPPASLVTQLSDLLDAGRRAA